MICINVWPFYKGTGVLLHYLTEVVCLLGFQEQALASRLFSHGLEIMTPAPFLPRGWQV